MKERELREQMERELRSKEQQLTDVTKRQSELEMKLLKLNLNETETKSDNDRLQKVNENPLDQIFDQATLLTANRKRDSWKSNFKRSLEVSKSRNITSPNCKIRRRKKNEIERSKFISLREGEGGNGALSSV